MTLKRRNAQFAAHNQGQSKTLFDNKCKKKCTLCVVSSFFNFGSSCDVLCTYTSLQHNVVEASPTAGKKTVELFPLRYKCSTEHGNICTLEQAWSVRANRWAGDSCRKLYQDFALSSRLSHTAATKMPKCPKCEKEVYFGKI